MSNDHPSDDNRRKFLLRFAGAAIAASGTGTAAFADERQERGPVAVYGPPPRRPVDPREAAFPLTFLYADGASELSPEAKAMLDGHMDLLRQTPAAIIVKTHADDKGSREKNLEISERRGEAVKKHLLLGGVPMARIEVFPYGRERPADPGDSPEAKAKNRRVEIVLTKW